jgi:hypothetical protein
MYTILFAENTHFASTGKKSIMSLWCFLDNTPNILRLALMTRHYHDQQQEQQHELGAR